MSDENAFIPPIPVPPVPVPPVPVPPRPDDSNGYTVAGGITPGPHHLHKVVILLWALRFFVPLAIVAMSSILAPLMEGEVTGAEIPTYALALIPIGIVVVVAVVACVYAYLSYKNFTWEITDTELHVSRGIISKKQTHIPFQRIHSLDSTAKLIDRLLGVVTLNVQTAGSSHPEAVLAGLKLSDAEALRAEIFKRKSGLSKAHALAAQGAVGAVVEGALTSMGATVDRAERSIDAVARGGNLMHELDSVSSSLRGAFGGQTYGDEAPIEFERKLSTKELLLAAVSGKSTGALIFAGIAAAMQLFGSFGVSDDALMSMTESAFRYVLSMGALAVAGLIFFLVVIVWLASVFSAFISYGGFTVRRRGGRLEVERGLLSRRFNGIAIERIQSVVVKRGLVRRMIGYAEVAVSTVSNVSSSDSSSKNNGDFTQGVLIHPFIRYSELEAFMSDALPEFANAPKELKTLPMVSLRRSLFRSVVWPAILYAGIAAVFNFSIQPLLSSVGIVIPLWLAPSAALVLLVPGVIYGYLSWKQTTFAHNRTMLLVQKGVYTLETSYIPRRKIQWAQASSNPFQRLAQVETLRTMTAAGDSGTKNVVRDMHEEAAEELIEWARPHHKEPILPDAHALAN